MWDELLVFVGAELILLVSIAAITLYGRRMDVLSGRYFSNTADRAVSLGWNIDRVRRWVERERKVHRLKKTRARTSNAGRLRPTAVPIRDRTMETISRNRRRSRSPIIPASPEVDDHAVRIGKARFVKRATSWG
jgi:hypothetical protein